MRRRDPEQRREVVARGPGCWGSGLRAQWVGSTADRQVVRRGSDKGGACDTSGDCSRCSLFLSEFRPEAPGTAGRASPALLWVSTGVGTQPLSLISVLQQSLELAGTLLWPLAHHGDPWPTMVTPGWVPCHSCSTVHLHLLLSTLEIPRT